MKITIFGAGKFGSSVAQALLFAKHDITVIDRSPDVIDRLSARMDLKTVCANAKSIDNLQEWGVDESDIVIACTDSDDRNMVLCALSKELGAKCTVARVRGQESIEHMAFIKQALSIDYIMNPDYACAVEMYKHIVSRSGVSEGLSSVNGMFVVEFDASRLYGFSGGILKDKAKLLSGLLVAAISRNGKIIIPSGNTEILPDDRIFVVGDRAQAIVLRKQIILSKADKKINNVAIAGGGKTAVFLAKLLMEDNIKVKIIESNHDRAKMIANKLEKADIVYGDATDFDLLFEEDIHNMDAFISCTGIDEENLLLALMANKAGVGIVAAKTSRMNYESIIENLGDIMTINPISLCTADVIRYLSDDKKVVFAKLIQGQAEFTELVAEENMPIVGKTISQVQLPEGILIASIFRNDKLIIPDGNTEIHNKDRLVLLSLLSQVPEIEKLINKNSTGEF